VAGARTLGQHGFRPLRSQSALFAAGNADFPADTFSEPELVLGREQPRGRILRVPRVHQCPRSYTVDSAALRPRHNNQIGQSERDFGGLSMVAASGFPEPRCGSSARLATSAALMCGLTSIGPKICSDSWVLLDESSP
jgi:hypothetical protein